MGRRVIKIEVILLYILAMIAFMGREAESAFLQDRVVAVPERRSEGQQLISVTNAG